MQVKHSDSCSEKCTISKAQSAIQNSCVSYVQYFGGCNHSFRYAWHVEILGWYIVSMLVASFAISEPGIDFSTGYFVSHFMCMWNKKVRKEQHIMANCFFKMHGTSQQL